MKRMKLLQQLQQIALQQLKRGLFWLRQSIEESQEAAAAASAAAAAAAAAAGPSSAADVPCFEGGGGGTAAEAAAAAAEAAAEAAANRVAAVIIAIEMTAHRRRSQVFGDPLLSHWLRETETPERHHGILM